MKIEELVNAVPCMKIGQCKNFICLVAGAVIVGAGVYVISKSAYNIGVEEALIKVSEKIFKED